LRNCPPPPPPHTHTLMPPPPPPNYTPSSRELISNASDALEKVRHMQVAGQPVRDAETPLAIHVLTNEVEGTITFVDTGVGMTSEELVENLGTIARSGSRAFLAKLRASSGEGSSGGGSGSGGGNDTGSNIIGQFGVGFYSAFMVADSVRVFSMSASPSAPGYAWSSAGDGAYSIAPATGCARGSKVVIKLREACREFASAAAVKAVIVKHSNFVNFPIFLNGAQVNTVRALWTLPKADVTEEQYTEFYKYKSGDFEAPLYRLHFSADAPTAIKALLYIGSSHEEKYGMGRVKPGTDLYSRKVLIEASSGILPDWARFVQGVVDSEDIPLNISRETMQDSALHRRLRAVLTRRLLRFLETESRRDAEAYNTKFFPEFGQFLKEGAITDAPYAGDIAKLLRFESTAAPPGSLTSLDEYVSRMPPGQGAIYYLVAPHRGIAEASPYMEGFKGVEVLFLYSSIDDFVMNNLREYNGRKLTTAETADLNPETLLGAAAGAGAGAKKAAPAAAEGEGAASSGSEGGGTPTNASGAAAAAAAGAEDGAPAAGGGGGMPAPPPPLTPEAMDALAKWMVREFPTKISRVRPTNRLRSSPCVVTDHESSSLRRMMRMVESSSGKDAGALRMESHVLPKQSLEVNPSHPVIIALAGLKDSQQDLARTVVEQLLDNALVAAGLVDDPRAMLPRLNALLERVVGVAGAGGGYAGEAALEARRWVSPREARERETVREGEELVSGMEREAAKAGGKK
jgi:TNF receptor-associated protein 1